MVFEKRRTLKWDLHQLGRKGIPLRARSARICKGRRRVRGGRVLRNIDRGHWGT